ncbi:hypothetical protein K443DRAFT_12976 [Laccaria amethystina LaAM-08-1]|uniref:Uncharacterized protein n=1 Tax=Laccaria amethystina LaAM-08-1 TaxID=1095629 RepID=A0A0C9X6J2_9AGAR|nr:hypothetical protein K443DRAFT_12976 [Laccaria amethystina LaAM-08-1]
MDFRRTLPFPMDPADSLMDFHRIQAKSDESLLKPRNGWTGWNSVSVGLPMDFRWTSDGQRQKQLIMC